MQHLLTEAHLCVLTCAHTNIQVYTQIYIHVFRHMRAHIHTGIAWVFVQIRAYSSRDIHTWMIWASIYTCTWIYTYIYTCTHKQLLWPPDAVPHDFDFIMFSVQCWSKVPSTDFYLSHFYTVDIEKKKPAPLPRSLSIVPGLAVLSYAFSQVTRRRSKRKCFMD